MPIQVPMQTLDVEQRRCSDVHPHVHTIDLALPLHIKPDATVGICCRLLVHVATELIGLGMHVHWHGSLPWYWQQACRTLTRRAASMQGIRP